MLVKSHTEGYALKSSVVVIVRGTHSISNEDYWTWNRNRIEWKISLPPCVQGKAPGVSGTGL